MRTYAGHSSAAASNALYRRNLDKGQTGLSVAFDLPTQTGYDPDHVLARGEVGKVGVPISHIGDMRALFEQIPLDRMNTSMTINATAMWLLAMYQVAAEEQAQAAGEDPRRCQGARRDTRTTSSRSTFAGPSLRARAVAAPHHRHVSYTVAEYPEVEPDQHCSYHLRRRGDALQEIAYAMSTRSRPRRDTRRGAGAAGAVRRGRRPHLVLRQCRGPVRRGDVQDARLRPVWTS